MFMVLEDTVNSPAPLPGTTDSATQRVASVITATGWPNNDSPTAGWIFQIDFV